MSPADAFISTLSVITGMICPVGVTNVAPKGKYHPWNGLIVLGAHYGIRSLPLPL